MLPARKAMMTGPEAFVFLNRPGKLTSSADWNAPEKDKLWLYNLHYFDDLNAAGAQQRYDWHRALIERWIAENPAPQGNGWEPYPLSLRIVNWIKWALAGHELEEGWRQSLAEQIRFLGQRLEWHLLGNHLFTNAKALVFAGVFFSGKEADSWLAKGLKILAREIPEQILPDGGHFELSPMYHSIILEDILDLVNLAGAFPGRIADHIVQGWREVAGRMLYWLEVMCHPDGRIAFFNDAAFGIALEPVALKAYASNLGIAGGQKSGEGITHLTHSGYIRVQRGEMVALLDVGRIGPDYIPGHAHADTLSFELSLGAQRVLVNSGISQYGTGPMRDHQRSTRAHNTVEIDGENSSEVWGGFRVARRARPFDLQIKQEGEVVTVSCAHDGYCRLAGKAVHRRIWKIGPCSVTVSDSVSGQYRRALARYHVFPDVQIDAAKHEGLLTIGANRQIRWHVDGGEAGVTASQYHPEFGRAVANSCLTIAMVKRQCQMTFQW